MRERPTEAQWRVLHLAHLEHVLDWAENHLGDDYPDIQTIRATLRREVEEAKTLVGVED